MFIQVEPSDASEDNTTKPTTSLFQYFRTVLCFGGIYCGEGNTIRRWKKKVALFIVLIHLVHIPLFSVEIYSRFAESGQTTRPISFLMMCAANVFLGFVSLVKMPKDLMELERVFSVYMEKYQPNLLSSNRLRQLRIMFSFTLVVCIMYGPVQLLLYRQTQSILCAVHPSCFLPGNWTYFGFTLNVLFLVTSQIQWQMQYLVCMIFTIFLLREFKTLAQKFKDLSMSGASNVGMECAVLVEHHECLVDVLFETNNCMRHHSFVIVFLSIPVNCLFLYAAISKPLTQQEMMFVCCGLTLVISFVIGIVAMEGLVSSKAHEPLRYIWKLRKRVISESRQQTLDLFLTRLTGETIGFNIYGLLSITLPTLLGIIGSLATYTIVVVQFKPTEAPLCNPTLMGNVTSTA